MAMKNQKSAFWALAAAGGLWAWQNRDMIKGYINQSGILSQGGVFAQGDATSHRRSDAAFDVTPATGETRRIDTGSGSPADFTNETRTNYDPAI